MVELKKIETHLQQLPQKNKLPLTDQTPSRISTIVQQFTEWCFYIKKDLNGYMHYSSDAHHLIKKKFTPSKISHCPSTGGEVLPHPLTLFGKPWSVTYPGFFWHTVNYTTSGYMLNADGHLPGRYRFLMF